MIRVDDHGSLAAAIASLDPARGGEVVLANRTYDVPGGTRFAHVHNLTVRGEGHATRVRLVGDGDIAFGNSKRGEMRNLRLRDLAIVTSAPRKGWALRLDQCVRTTIDHVAVDPVDAGWRHEQGIWINQFDDVTLTNIEVNCRRTSLLVNGRHDQGYGGDLYLGGGSKITNFRTPAEWLPGSVGVHLAGAAGGVHLTEADIIYCGVGVLLDTAVAGVQNREVFFDSGCYVDSCAEDCVRLGPKAAGKFQADGAWIATAGLRSGGWPNGNGVNVHHDNGQCVGVIAGGTVFNCAGTGVAISGGRWGIGGMAAIHDNGGHGIHRASSKASVQLGDRLVYANRRGDLGGF